MGREGDESRYSPARGETREADVAAEEGVGVMTGGGKRLNGKIATEVINHYGDEVLKVYDVGG